MMITRSQSICASWASLSAGSSALVLPLGEASASTWRYAMATPCSSCWITRGERCCPWASTSLVSEYLPKVLRVPCPNASAAHSYAAERQHGLHPHRFPPLVSAERGQARLQFEPPPPHEYEIQQTECLELQRNIPDRHRVFFFGFFFVFFVFVF